MKLISLSSLFGIVIICLATSNLVNAKGKGKGKGKQEGKSVTTEASKSETGSGSTENDYTDMSKIPTVDQLAPNDRDQMVGSKQPGCAEVNCMEPSDAKKASGCKPHYMSPIPGTPGINHCCATWICEYSSNSTYANNNTQAGNTAGFPNGPPANYQFYQKVETGPPGANLNYTSAAQSTSFVGPSSFANSQASSYNYRSSYSSGTPPVGGMMNNRPMMPFMMPMDG